MNRIFKITFIISLILAVFSMPAFSGRTRITNIPDENYSKIDDLEAEIRFGRDLAARILGNYKLLDNPDILIYVNRIGKGISLYSGRPELKFYFAVLDTDEINAFATPGGYIFVTRGALEKMSNEAQLASVLGHEIAHVTLRHVVRRLDIRGESGSTMSALSGMIGGSTAAFRNLLEKSLNKAADILFESGYKLKDELEADTLGTLMASSAGYHPSALKNYLIISGGFEKKDASYKKEHPQINVRMKNLNKTLIKNGLLKINQAKVRRRFHETLKN